MGQLAKRAAAVVGRAAGNTVSPAVAALLIASGQPELVGAAIPASALAGSLTEEGFAFVRQVWQDRAARVERLADSAADASGLTIEALLNEAMADPRKLELLARAVEVASHSLDEWKIDLLARALVDGTSDEAMIDQALVLTDLLRQLEVPHLRLLVVLADPGPVEVGTRALPDPQLNAGQSAHVVWFNGGPPRRTGMAAWDVESIVRRLPGLEQGLPALMSKLESLGLAYGVWDEETLKPHWVSTVLGRACIRRLTDRGGADDGQSDSE